MNPVGTVPVTLLGVGVTVSSQPLRLHRRTRRRCLLTLSTTCRNVETFEEIAATVHQGLLDLGVDAILVHCPSLVDLCTTPAFLDHRRVCACVGSGCVCLSLCTYQVRC